MIGRTIGGYRIVEQVGMGGMATVYKAYDANTDRYVALKTLPEQFSKDPQFVERFRREAIAIAKLEHLHILPLFAYGEDDGVAYLAMRYLPAGTLSNYIRQKGQMPLGEAARLLNQIAGALDHAHANGVLHRDIKPTNVLVDKDANTYLTDFGIARMVEGTLDLTGDAILGTPQYMSPEQCKASKDLTPASDQYSLGVVLYEMVTGRVPFQAETPLAVIIMQLNGADLPLPTALRPDLPEAAELVILKALSRDPADRYPSCEAFARAFTQAVENPQAMNVTSPAASAPSTVMSKPTTPIIPSVDDLPTTVQTPPAPRPALSPMLIGGVVIAAIVVIGGLALLSGRPAAPVVTSTPLPEQTQAALLPTATSLPATVQSEPTQTAVLPSPTAAEAANPLAAIVPTLMAQGDAGAAINLLIPAITQTPKDAQLYLLRGQAYHQNGNSEAALADFTQAISLAPQLAEAYVQRATVYYESDKRPEALADISEAIKLRPDQADLYAKRGMGYRDASELDKSLADYDKAIALDPKNAEWYAERATTYSWRSELDKAITDLNKAIELDPKFLNAYLQRGSDHRWMEQYELALADFMKARELDPNSFASYRGTVDVYLTVLDQDKSLANYDLDAALADANKAVELSLSSDGTTYTDAGALYDRGRIHNHRNEPTDAISDFTQALKINEASPEAYINRGYAYTNDSQFEAARADFTRALELSKDNVDAYLGRVEAYLQAIDNDKPWKDYDLNSALADVNAALIVDNGNGVAYLLRGKIYSRQGDNQKALDDLNKTVEMAGDMAWGYQERANIQHALGNTDAALADYQKALTLDPSDSWTYALMGDTLYDAGRRAEALTAYQTYTKLVGEAAVESVRERIIELQKTP